jgi:hypothetical protein
VVTPPEKPLTPEPGDSEFIPETPGHTLSPGSDGVYLEIGPDGTPLGEWHWDEQQQVWIFEEYAPLGLPHAGNSDPAVPGIIPLYLLSGWGLMVTLVYRIWRLRDR